MAKARFSMAFEEAAGNLGANVVVRGKSGPVVRRQAVYKRRSTPEQLVQEGRLKAVAAIWSEFGAAEAQAWNAYAATIEKRDSVTGVVYSPSGYNAFSALALRILQMDASAAVPHWPPSGTFAGDEIIVDLRFSIDDLGTFLSVRSGAITFEASGANVPGVVTELMIQKLANVRRTPTTQYKSAAFVAFDTTHLTADVPVEPGIYACAFRFVERATGRATGIQTLGVVTVS
jgi:hypothetical protein